MSTIVKIRNSKTGILYAYEQTAKWDATKKQSRPTRKYLGRVDEETNTIIPSTGRKGRPKTDRDVPTMPDPAEEYPELLRKYRSLSKELETCQQELSEVKAENKNLRRKVREAGKLLNNASESLNGLIGTLDE